MIGRYGAEEHDERLGKLLDAENARQAGAQRKRYEMREKLLALGATAADLEKNVGVMTLADNVCGMPRGYIVGLVPVDALEACLAGAARLMPENPHQKPPRWLALALEQLQGERQPPADAASVAEPEPVPAAEPVADAHRAAVDTEKPVAAVSLSELSVEEATAKISACVDVDQLEKWMDAEAVLGAGARPEVLDALNTRVDALFRDDSDDLPVPAPTPDDRGAKAKPAKRGKR